MAFEVIKNIVEAEEKVETIKAQALADAAAIKKEAKAKAEQLLEDSKKLAQENRVKAIEQAVNDSRPQAEEILAKSKEMCNAVREAAAKNKEDAVKSVLGKVVGINGDS